MPEQNKKMTPQEFLEGIDLEKAISAYLQEAEYEKRALNMLKEGVLSLTETHIKSENGTYFELAKNIYKNNLDVTFSKNIAVVGEGKKSAFKYPIHKENFLLNIWKIYLEKDKEIPDYWVTQLYLLCHEEEFTVCSQLIPLRATSENVKNWFKENVINSTLLEDHYTKKD